MKFKIIISKFFEETIEANSEDEAFDLAWEQWSQDDEVEAYCYEVEE